MRGYVRKTSATTQYTATFRSVDELYDSLHAFSDNTPSKGYGEVLMRMQD